MNYQTEKKEGRRLSALIVLLISFTMIFPAQIFALDTGTESLYREFLKAASSTPLCTADINQDGIISPGSEASACVNGICPIGAEECAPTLDPACPADQPNCKPPTNWTCQSDPGSTCALLPNARTVSSGPTCENGVFDPSLNTCVSGWKVVISGRAYQQRMYDIYVDPNNKSKLCSTFYWDPSADNGGSCLTFAYDPKTNTLNTTGTMEENGRWKANGKTSGINWLFGTTDLPDTTFSVGADKKVLVSGTTLRPNYLHVVGNGNKLDWYNSAYIGSLSFNLEPTTTPAQNFTYTVPSCSRNTCAAQDLSTLEPPKTKEYSSKQNDGATDPTGACLDEILIFNGKPGECFKPSLATAWYNCCKPIPKVEKPEGVEVGESAAAAMAAAEAVLLAMKAAEIAMQAVTSTLAVMGPMVIAAAVIMVAMELLVTGCPEEGFEVATAKGEERSVYIGSYCVHDSFFGCLQSAEVHCTFMSQLGRIIHEQGRPQLKRFIKSYDAAGKPIVDWGTIEAPRCEGFKPAEFQALDFSQIDMSEFFDDVQQKAQAELEGKKEEFQENIQQFYKDVKR